MILKTIISAIVTGCFLLSLTGCATFPAKVFPETDIVIISKSPHFGVFVYSMEKGFFTDKSKSWQWMPRKHYEEKQRKLKLKKKEAPEDGRI